MNPLIIASVLLASLGVHAQSDEAQDSDGDGVPDVVERFFCSDENDPDTDDDGLDDFVEIVLGAGDPTVAETLGERETRLTDAVVGQDSDGDGVCDCTGGECGVNGGLGEILEQVAAATTTCDPTAPPERVSTVTGSTLTCGQAQSFATVAVLFVFLLLWRRPSQPR